MGNIRQGDNMFECEFHTLFTFNIISSSHSSNLIKIQCCHLCEGEVHTPEEAHSKN